MEKLKLNRLECDIVDHCNLRCTNCSHLSPDLNKYLVNPMQFQGDINLIARYATYDHFIFIGGEPLLHPQIMLLLAYVNLSRIARRIEVSTNGALLHKMPNEFFQTVDRINICFYPDTKIDKFEVVHFVTEMRHKYDFEVDIKDKTTFRESTRPYAIEPSQNIYDECKVIHEWGCHNFRDGIYYKCARPLHIKQYHLKHDVADNYNYKQDGIDIHDPDFKRCLEQYIAYHHPLHSCHTCWGTSGAVGPHSQRR